ncbi:MAG: hypothetical protein EPN41_07775 [Candidimonas sp.]|nr:MAG: hypothetical protein EPN41_07775 [Candidimonas sp.]
MSEQAVEAWRAWHMPRVDEISRREQAGSKASVADQAALDHARLVQECENQRNQARQQGYADGYAHGLSQGLPHGQAEGFNEGLARGLLESRTRVTALCAQLEQLIARTEAGLAELDAQVGDALIALALRIAAQVTGCAVVAAPQNLREAVSRALKTLDAPLNLKICAPSQAITQLKEGIDESQYPQANWQWEADDSLNAGEFRILTDSGLIDARLHNRWLEACARLGLDAGAATRLLDTEQSS